MNADAISRGMDKTSRVWNVQKKSTIRLFFVRCFTHSLTHPARSIAWPQLVSGLPSHQQLQCAFGNRRKQRLVRCQERQRGGNARKRTTHRKRRRRNMPARRPACRPVCLLGLSVGWLARWLAGSHTDCIACSVAADYADFTVFTHSRRANAAMEGRLSLQTVLSCKILNVDRLRHSPPRFPSQESHKEGHMDIFSDRSFFSCFLFPLQRIRGRLSTTASRRRRRRCYRNAPLQFIALADIGDSGKCTNDTL